MENRVDLLLQEIQNIVLCRYLSDLHSSAANFDERSKAMISNIPVDRYTLDEWNEAAAYVTGTVCNYHSVREAKEHISHSS